MRWGGGDSDVIDVQPAIAGKTQLRIANFKFIKSSLLASIKGRYFVLLLIK